MSERWIITPANGRPLVLPLAQDGGAQIVGIATPSPARRVSYAPRPEGAAPTSREWENREITLEIALVPPRDQWAKSTHDFGVPAPEAEGDGDLPGWTGNVRRVGPDGRATTPMLSDLTATVASLAAAGGVVRRVLDDGTWLDFDVLDGELVDGPTWDVTYFTAGATTVTVKLTCAPFGRGRERLIGQGTLAAGRRLLEVGGLTIPGDISALARLEFSGVGSPQRSLMYSIDQPSPSAPPAQVPIRDLEAPEGTATSDNGAMYPTQARVTNVGPQLWRTLALLHDAASGRPLEAAGTFRVYARLRATAPPGGGSPSRVDTFRARLRWAAGAREGGLSENATVAFPIGSWVLADLGQIHVPADVGRLDGALEVAGPASSQVLGDLLLFVPTERSAIASASFAPAVTGGIAAMDPLTGTGAFDGTAAKVGGPWKAFGSGPPWTRTANGATKTAGMMLEFFTTTFSTESVRSAITVPVPSTQVTVSTGAPQISRDSWYAFGLIIGDAAGIASFMTATSTGNAPGWAMAISSFRNDGKDQAALFKLAGGQYTSEAMGAAEPPTSTGRTYLAIRADGSVVASYGGTPVSGTAGPNAPTSGVYAGIFSFPMRLDDAQKTTVVVSDFLVESAVAPDAVLYPGKAATVSSARATRTTTSGMTGALSSYYGDRPLLPPSGRQGTSARVLMGTSRDDLRTGIDSTTGDAFTGRVFATPRYLQIPDENA